MEGFLIDFDSEVRGDRPNLLSALVHALQVHEGTMAFVHCMPRETGLLKMSVDVGGVDEIPEGHVFCPSGKDAKAVVRSRIAVEV